MFRLGLYMVLLFLISLNINTPDKGWFSFGTAEVQAETNGVNIKPFFRELRLIDRRIDKRLKRRVRRTLRRSGVRLANNYSRSTTFSNIPPVSGATSFTWACAGGGTLDVAGEYQVTPGVSTLSLQHQAVLDFNQCSAVDGELQSSLDLNAEISSNNKLLIGSNRNYTGQLSSVCYWNGIEVPAEISIDLSTEGTFKGAYGNNSVHLTGTASVDCDGFALVTCEWDDVAWYSAQSLGQGCHFPISF